MAESEKKQSFWTTLPGILTGIAALLTAVTGFFVAVYPHSFNSLIGTAESPPAHVDSSTKSSATVPVAATTASPVSTPQQKHTAMVLVTAMDGTATRLFLKSFKLNAVIDDELSLAGGQMVPFDKIRSIDFLAAHENQRDVKVTLTDGRVVDGALSSSTADYFRGETDIGPFTIYISNLKQVSFER